MIGSERQGGSERTEPARSGIVNWTPLRPYLPPFRERSFWLIQGIVAVVGVVHYGLETLRLQTQAYSFDFVPIALFMVPVIVASFRFGFPGSLATGAWVAVLSLPNLFLLHSDLEIVGEVAQLTIVVAAAVYIGYRVDRETTARQQAQATEVALRTSETKYRGLFESSPIAVLVLDGDGVIVDTNPAVAAVVGWKGGSLRGAHVSDLVGAANAERLTTPAFPDDTLQHDPVILERPDGSRAYLEPIFTSISSEQGDPLVQTILQDVTVERLRNFGLRAYAAYVLQAQEEERTRIAQELHDEAVQELILLCRQLDAIEDTGGPPLPEPTIEKLREARRDAEGVVAELRDFARALRPPTLDDLGLIPSVRRLLLDLGERTNTEGHVHVKGDERRLSPDTELGVFRIAQEALHNVERHAHATEVSATISFTGGTVGLEIVDNGAGFTPLDVHADYATSSHLGLLGMRERAALLNGTLEIESSPGKGTRVILTVATEQ